MREVEQWPPLLSAVVAGFALAKASEYTERLAGKSFSPRCQPSRANKIQKINIAKSAKVDKACITDGDINVKN